MKRRAGARKTGWNRRFMALQIVENTSGQSRVFAGSYAQIKGSHNGSPQRTTNK